MDVKRVKQNRKMELEGAREEVRGSWILERDGPGGGGVQATVPGHRQIQGPTSAETGEAGC